VTLAGADVVRALFAKRFGGAPAVVASAPGRVNLIGEHTDYNGGEVLPIAIGRRTYVAARARDGGGGDAAWRAVSSFDDAVATVDVGRGREARGGEWWDYVIGVAAQLASGAGGGVRVDLPAIDLAVSSDVPVGAGLSSSSALCVAVAEAVLAVAGHEWPMRDVALVAHRAECDFVGVAVGIMDQFASALARGGAALHIWCETTAYEYVPCGDAVLIFDTAVPRALRTSMYNARRAECEEALALLQRGNPGLRGLAQATADEVRAAGLPAPLDRRALHVVEETRRVGLVVDALRRVGVVPGGELYASHESLRLLYECSTEELDWFVDEVGVMAGVRGARLTGAGWGGCAIAVGDPDGLAAAAPELASRYEGMFGRAPRVWLTTAGAGAGVD
jgi:galactokinase